MKAYVTDYFLRSGVRIYAIFLLRFLCKTGFKAISEAGDLTCELVAFVYKTYNIADISVLNAFFGSYNLCAAL